MELLVGGGLLQLGQGVDAPLLPEGRLHLRWQGVKYS